MADTSPQLLSTLNELSSLEKRAQELRDRIDAKAAPDDPSRQSAFAVLGTIGEIHRELRVHLSESEKTGEGKRI